MDSFSTELTVVRKQLLKGNGRQVSFGHYGSFAWKYIKMECKVSRKVSLPNLNLLNLPGKNAWFSSVVISDASESWTLVRSPLKRPFVLRTGPLLLLILLYFFRRSTGTDMDTHPPVKFLTFPNFWTTNSLNRPIHAFNDVFIKLSTPGSLQLWQVLMTSTVARIHRRRATKMRKTPWAGRGRATYDQKILSAYKIVYR